MSALRKIDLYVNVPRSQETDSAGNIRTNPIRFFNQEHVLLRIHLLDAAGAAYPLDTGLVCLLGLDNSFAADHADPAVALNAAFVPADWIGDDGWSLASGRICARLNLATSEMNTAMGAGAEKKFWLCLWAGLANEPPMLVFQIQIAVTNVSVRPSAPEPVEGGTYVTTDMLAGLATSAEIAAVAALLNIAGGKRLKIDAAGNLSSEDIP